jgi:hypothetical protein
LFLGARLKSEAAFPSWEGCPKGGVVVVLVFYVDIKIIYVNTSNINHPGAARHPSREGNGL